MWAVNMLPVWALPSIELIQKCQTRRRIVDVAKGKRNKRSQPVGSLDGWCRFTWRSPSACLHVAPRARERTGCHTEASSTRPIGSDSVGDTCAYRRINCGPDTFFGETETPNIWRPCRPGAGTILA